MGIKALSLTAIEPFVSTSDPAYNAVTRNLADIEAWDRSKAKDKGERPEPLYAHADGATVWQLGTLNSILMSILADDVTSFGAEGAMVIRSADNDVLAARMGLKGWENFTDDAGHAIPFATETMTVRGQRIDLVRADLIERIPIPVLREIGRKVKQSNSLDAITAKNSASASSV